MIPAETGGCWAILLQSGIQSVSVLGSGIQGRLLFGRHSVRPPGVLSSYSNNRDVMDWWWRLLPFSPHSPQCSSVCVTDELKLDVQMTRNVSFVWNVRAIWISSSCSLPTCSIVRLGCCCTWVSHFMEADYSQKSENKWRHFLAICAETRVMRKLREKNHTCKISEDDYKNQYDAHISNSNEFYPCLPSLYFQV